MISLFKSRLTGLFKNQNPKYLDKESINDSLIIPFLSLGAKPNKFTMQFAKNNNGRDFFIGDLHGCYEELPRVSDIKCLGNTVYLDTGAGAPRGRLSLIKYEEIIKHIGIYKV